MKHFRLIAGTAFVLFIIGFFSSSCTLKLTGTILGGEILGSTIWESLYPKISFGLLLAFCSISAGVLLWAYSKNRSSYSSIPIFGFGLLVSIISAIVGVWLKLLEIRNMFAEFGDKPKITFLAAGSIDYFSWGV